MQKYLVNSKKSTTFATAKECHWAQQCKKVSTL